MILDAITPKQPRLLVADLDGTLLHDAEVFEDRFITQRSIDTINRAHDAGLKFAIATARPVSTGLQFAEKLPVDAVIYLNGALIDFDPAHSDFDLLTSGATPADENHLIKIGFSSRRACEVCLFLLDRMPGLKLGIVMNDVRYTNFDVRVYWKTQAFQYTNFHDVPEGVADKITIFPEPEQWNELRALIPPDFDISISEGVMWMLMNPQANKAWPWPTRTPRCCPSPTRSARPTTRTASPNGLKRSWVEPVETREHAKIELVLNRGYALNRCSKKEIELPVGGIRI